MALYSIKDRNLEHPQNSIGRKDYWDLFKQYQDTPLHELLRNEIKKLLTTAEDVNSRMLGKTILTEAGKYILALEQSIDDEQLRSLFGMTLWNTLAETDDTWHFMNEAKNHPEDKSAMLYFRHN